MNFTKIRDNEMNKQPFFSIIIPTRNRPELFEKALDSVTKQNFSDIEIIIINDGSDNEFWGKYKQIIDSQSIDLHWVSLLQRKNGHGQSYSMNQGASLAKGKYLCFLDDDDYWTDPSHLAIAHKAIMNSDTKVDLYYANQKAFYSDGTMKNENIWIEDLVDHFEEKNKDFYIVEPDFLLQSIGFAHLNCSIFRTDFYLAIGGMDENIRYECDRDIYIRSIDKAQNIIYQPKFVSYHNIPDANNTANMSTLVTDVEKKIYQLNVYDKGVLKSDKVCIKKYCMNGKMYQLKHLAEIFFSAGKNDVAYFYAKQALSIKYTFKWHAFGVYLKLKTLIN